MKKGKLADVTLKAVDMRSRRIDEADCAVDAAYRFTRVVFAHRDTAPEHLRRLADARVWAAERYRAAAVELATARQQLRMLELLTDSEEGAEV